MELERSVRSLLGIGLTAALLSTTGLAHTQPYGTGKAGAGGFTPLLTATAANVGNQSFSVRVDRVLANSTVVFLFSTAEGQVPYAGGNVLVSVTPPNPFLILPVVAGGVVGVPGAGSATFPLPLPNQPAFAGLEFYVQALVNQTTAGQPGIALSQGLRVELTLPPQVFVGSSIAGTNDPYQVIDPYASQTLDAGANAHTDNVTAAAYGYGGKALFVASSIQNAISLGDAGATPVLFQTIYTSAGQGCYGLGLDARHDLLWTLTDPGTGSRELVALHAEPGGTGFGTVAYNTLGMGSGALIEPWALSPSGRYAAVLSIFPTQLILVDTDPTSPTFLQTLTTTTLPTSGAIFTLGTQVRFSPDDQIALVTVQNAGTPSEIARFHVPTLTWMDHNSAVPGIQHIGTFSAPSVFVPDAATHADFSSNGAFAIVGGFGLCGWMGRLDFDLTDPDAWTYTLWQQGTGLSNTWRFDLDGNNDFIVAATWTDGGCGHFLGSPALVLIDAFGGGLLSHTPIPQNGNPQDLQNLYTVVYR